MSECIVGIDLGTTNSEIAAFLDGQVRVIGPGDTRMLPSCVGFTPSGETLVGEAARNQHALHPERTVRSIKRQMGNAEPVTVAGKTLTPQEISALILRELVEWAARALGHAPEKAVITVPAYFSDAQRNATREAGVLAGLDVVRIINEPTAASLAYGLGEGSRHTTLIYDLGGGTFDVSVLMCEGDVTEVLSSHGNNQLGGDDFDDLLAAHLAKAFHERHAVELADRSAGTARLWWAAEEAKRKLSAEPHIRIREEALATEDGTPLHLDLEMSRDEYEELIRPLIESTLDSTATALRDAGKTPDELNEILLVGGSTRTPLVSRLLRERIGIDPSQAVHPDLCVALGAGVLASRMAGRAVERVLVDVSPYSFGVSYLGERGGVSYPHCYRPIIPRNTPLPLTRTEQYMTATPYQTAVDIQVYQGEDEDALRNVLVGDFKIDDLTPIDEPNEILCRMRLDIDGILEVTAVEKRTGTSKHISIANAMRPKNAAEIAAGRQRIRELYESRGESLDPNWSVSPDEDWVGLDAPSDQAGPASVEADPPIAVASGQSATTQLLERSRTLLDNMHEEDREAAIELHDRIATAIETEDASELLDASRALEELLFFVEGHR